MPDRGHLDNNPIDVKKEDIVKCLDEIVNSNPLSNKINIFTFDSFLNIKKNNCILLD